MLLSCYILVSFLLHQLIIVKPLGCLGFSMLSCFVNVMDVQCCRKIYFWKKQVTQLYFSVYCTYTFQTAHCTFMSLFYIIYIHTVNHLLSGIYMEWVMLITWIFWLLQKRPYRHPVPSQKNTFLLYFLHWNLPRWCLLYQITKSSSLCCNGTCVKRMMSSTASGSGRFIL